MDDKEYDLETRKLRLSRERFWIGSVALVLVTAILNHQIQRREIQLKEIEEENKHLSQFVDSILDRDPYTRLFIAEYFQTLSHSERARHRWGDYKVLAEAAVFQEQEASRRRLQIQLRLSDIMQEISDPATQDERRLELQAELLQSEIDIEETQRFLAAVNPARPRTPRLSSTPNAAELDAVREQDPPQSLLLEVLGPVGTDQVTFELPYPMKLSWDLRKKVERVMVHRLAVPYFQAALTEIREAGLEEEANLFGGLFNKRKIRGGTTWSKHSWGVEIDLDPAGNAVHWGPERWRMDPRVVDVFEKNGFFWRGRTGFDAMSFVLSTDTIKEIGEGLKKQATESVE